MDQLNTAYAQEIQEFLKATLKADEVITYRPYVRHSQSQKGSKSQPPATDAHCDLTAAAGARQARQFLDDPEFQYSRHLHLSCWRTFSDPPQDWPLGLVDARTIPNEEGLVNSAIWQTEVPDLLNLPPLPSEVKSEAYIFPYNPKHQWKYFSNMTKDELLCLKLNDSDQTRPWRTCHSSFFNNEEGTHPRESVEIRACCYFK
jgi:hypothetical protein